jgi:DNA-binding FadR family transcriptional regulator
MIDDLGYYGSGPLFRRVADRLGRAIASGEHEAGRPLPREADLSASYHVGRSAVREAVKMLTAKGLVESHPRRGTIVRAVHYWNLFDPDLQVWLQDVRRGPVRLREALELRLGIEPQAAALAARRATPGDISRLREALERFGEVEQELRDACATCCFFHAAVLDATHNPFYLALKPTIVTAIHHLHNAAPAALRNLLHTRRTVCEAILARDPGAARARMNLFLTRLGEGIDEPAEAGPVEHASPRQAGWHAPVGGIAASGTPRR